VSVTTAPPAGALPPSVTVPVALAPPCTFVGDTVTDARPGGGTETVRDAVRVTLRKVAVMTADSSAVTTEVVTVKVANVAPTATLTFAGTAADVRLDERVTETPPAGDGSVNVTVPTALVPPGTVAGDTTTDATETVGSGRLTVAPPQAAMVALMRRTATNSRRLDA
jgi:hypothetical protein